MLCPSCFTNEAQQHITYGILACAACTAKRRRLLSPSNPQEFTTESIKEQRKAHTSDFLPMHNRGELDKGWVDRYGAKKAKQHGFSDNEIKRAKYVWNEGYYKKT